MRVPHTHDCVMSQGTIRDGLTSVEYYTTCPSPSQWAAIGVLRRDDRVDHDRRPCRMLVGTGRDEASAVAELTRRFIDACRAHQPIQPEPVSTQETPERVPSEPVPASISGELTADTEAPADTQAP